MKKLEMITILAMTLLSADAFAQASQSPEKKLESEEPAYISQRIEADLIRSIGPIDKEKLVGKWKKVLLGTREEKLGYYLQSGIKEGTQDDILNLNFSATEMKWLPGSAGVQINAIVSNLPKNHVRHEKVTQVLEPVLVTSPSEVRLEGNRAKFVISVKYPVEYTYRERQSGMIFDHYEIKGETAEYSVVLELSCGLQHDDQNRMLCEQKIDDGSKLSRLIGGDSGFGDVERAFYRGILANTGITAKLIGFERVE